MIVLKPYTFICCSKNLYALFCVLTVLFLHLLGLTQYLFEKKLSIDGIGGLMRVEKNVSLKNCSNFQVLVKSSVYNFANRRLMRSLWSKSLTLKFIVGHASNIIDEQNAITEADLFSDMIFCDFEDSYLNNCFKTMKALKIIAHNLDCGLLIDDDYMLNVDNIKKLLYHVPGDAYIGYVFNSSRPFRYIFSKWYVSLADYAFSRYPPYITAGCFLLTSDTAHKLLVASESTGFFKLDDVYLGILALRSGMTLTHHEGFVFWTPRRPTTENYVCVHLGNSFVKYADQMSKNLN